jgi:hypothetical protein
MFGHNDDDNNQPVNNQPTVDATTNDPAAPPPPVLQDNSLEEPNTFVSYMPHDSGQIEPQEITATASADKPDNDLPVAPKPTDPSTADNTDLLDIKQQALQALTPIVSHLDQTPEEKFRTTMMMIQANDNKSLLHDAYEAAQAITDEKAKAQALLDVINEINYFTQAS